ncbi:putative armadillo-like helical protein [Helianthus annuus]|nr:putative armadillo-like helical protein [Helianthus annuus]
MPNPQQNFSLWSSCRRKLIATMRCSCGISRHNKPINSPPVIKLPPEPSSEEKNVMMKETMKRLQSGENDVVLRGAKDVRELAKTDSEARTNFGLIGVIPLLVAMLDCEDVDSHIEALYALLNLGIGNDMNKSAIVEAGGVHKMLDLVTPRKECLPDVTAAVIANFLGLSAFDSNKVVIGSSGAVSFLIQTLRGLIKAETETKTDNMDSQVVQDCLRALYNLSILPTNVLRMIEIDGFVQFLLSAIGGDAEISERILLILSNIVSTPEGRRAVSAVHDAFTILVDVLSWMDSPNCQEKVAYILMVMAYKSSEDQQAMIEAGIKSSLLELTLLGSTLAQKRSSRILEILRTDKGKQVSENNGGGAGTTLSAPLCGSGDNAESPDSSSGFSNRNAVKHLVEQSLLSNMRKIVKRANLRQEFVSLEHLKSSVTLHNSSSKSLPF